MNSGLLDQHATSPMIDNLDVLFTDHSAGEYLHTTENDIVVDQRESDKQGDKASRASKTEQLNHAKNVSIKSPVF